MSTPLFPEVIEIDEQRTPTVDSVKGWLNSAGFVDIVSEEIVQQTYRSEVEHLEAARLRNTSVLNMISEVAFLLGVERLSQYITRNPEDPWLLFDSMDMTLQLLWHEYQEQHPQGYRYSQFCELYRRWAKNWTGASARSTGPGKSYSWTSPARGSRSPIRKPVR